MKICIIGRGIGKVFLGEIVGGAEKQSALIAEEFARRKYKVFILDTEYKYLNKLPTISGITFLELWDPDQGISGLRVINRIKGIVKKISAIQPDFIYCRAASFYNALILLSTKRTKIQFLWGLAAEMDLIPSINYNTITKPTFYDYLNHKILFTISAKVLLKYSDLVICQTYEQKQIVTGKCLNHIIASNIIKSAEIKNRNIASDKPVIWVGKLTGIKGEKELLTLAQHLSKYQIFVVGPVSERFQSTKTFKDIQAQENIVLLGSLNKTQLESYYKKSSILIHTGPTEGFSNTFLEAWSNNLPVVSLNVNPNGLLNNNNLGLCCHGDIYLMSQTIILYKRHETLLNEIGNRAYKYINENHSPKLIIDRLIKKLEQMQR